ncbi:MAG: hypothetical protein V1821_04195 [bacterium]
MENTGSRKAVGIYSQPVPPDFKPELVLRCEVGPDGRAALSGSDRKMADTLERLGVETADGEKLFPRDGERFLLALLLMKSSYWYARRIS